MERMLTYLGLLIIALPYILMLYSPSTIHPIIGPIEEYLSNGKGHKFVWAFSIIIMLMFLYYLMILGPIKANERALSKNIIILARVLMLSLGTLAITYIFYFEIPSYSNTLAAIAFTLVCYELYLNKVNIKNA